MKLAIVCLALAAFGQESTPAPAKPTTSEQGAPAPVKEPTAENLKAEVVALKAQVRFLNAQIKYNLMACNFMASPNVVAANIEIGEAQKEVEATKPKPTPTPANPEDEAQ